MSLAFDEDLADGCGLRPLGHGGQPLDRRRPQLAGILLIDDSDPRTYNDKNSLTTDPHDANRAYAVWLRWTDLEPQTATATFRSETYFSRTNNGGLAWEPARAIYTDPQEPCTVGDQIVVLPEGRLLDIFSEVAGDGSAKLAVLRGRDHGRVFDHRATYIHNAQYLGTYTPNV